MEQPPKKHMGLLYVALSAIFLFNPSVALVDPLPDAVGFLLLLIGVLRLADLSDRVSDAARGFRVMIFVGIGELLACYLTQVYMNGRMNEMHRYEHPAAVMLFSFVSIVLRFYFLLPAFRSLFSGIEALGERFGADALYTEDQKGRSACDVIKRRTTVFVILQALLSTLPELSALSGFFSPDGDTKPMMDWYRFVTLFRTVAVLASMIVGIVWLISFVRFMRCVLRQTDFLERVHVHYCTEILTQTLMLRMRRVRLARLLLGLGLPFTACLRIGGASVLPGAVTAIFTLIALTLLRTLLTDIRKCRATACGLLLFSVLQTVANRTYLSRYYPEAALYQTDAYYHFLAVRVLSVIEIMLTLWLVLALIEKLFEAIRTHTEVNYGTPNSAALSRAATERLHGELEKRLRLCRIVFVIAAILNAVDALFQLQFTWLWPIALTVSIVAVCMLISFMSELYTEIQNCYRTKEAYKRA